MSTKKSGFYKIHYEMKNAIYRGGWITLPLPPYFYTTKKIYYSSEFSYINIDQSNKLLSKYGGR